MEKLRWRQSLSAPPQESNLDIYEHSPHMHAVTRVQLVKRM